MQNQPQKQRSATRNLSHTIKHLSKRQSDQKLKANSNSKKVVDEDKLERCLAQDGARKQFCPQA